MAHLLTRVVLFAMLGGALDAAAQSAAPPAAPPGSADPTPEEIQRALQQDAASSARRSPAAQPSAADAPAPAIPLPSPVVRAFQSLNPDLSVIADFSAAWFNHPFDMPGDHDPHETGFQLQALELAIGATVDPYFRFDTNLTFSNDGVEIEEAYGTTLSLPAGFQVRAGKFFTRFGRFNPTHPHTWTFSDQPLVIGHFLGGDSNRGVGFEVSDLLPFVPWYAELVFSVTDARGATSNPSFLASDDRALHSVFQEEYLGALKQFFPLSDDWSLSWGLSAAVGPNSARDHPQLYGTDVYLKWRPVGVAAPPVFSVHAEWILRRYPVAGEQLADSGGFVQLLYRFQPRWVAALSAEYVEQDPRVPPDVGRPAGTQQRYKAALTVYPTEFSRLRLQYDFEPAGPRPETGHAVFTTVEFAIGAHGAHVF